MRERVEDWGKGLCRVLGKKLCELTGDYTPDIRYGLCAYFWCITAYLSSGKLGVVQKPLASAGTPTDAVQSARVEVETCFGRPKHPALGCFCSLRPVCGLLELQASNWGTSAACCRWLKLPEIMSRML